MRLWYSGSAEHTAYAPLCLIFGMLRLDEQTFENGQYLSVRLRHIKVICLLVKNLHAYGQASVQRFPV